MGILQINIENYKSIKKTSLTMEDISLLVGKNGSGKSNIISAINYFYCSLIDNDYDDSGIFDRHNSFNNEIKISILYDLKSLKMKSTNQLSKQDIKYKHFYKKIISISKPSTLLLVELTKIRGSKATFNRSYNDRELIYHLFPIYHIDARSINLLNWQNLWLEIGDLLKIETSKSELLHKDFNSFISNDSYKLDSGFQSLSTLLKIESIKLRKFTPKQFATIMSQAYFNGESFLFKNTPLNAISNGTNVFYYTKILLEVLFIISNNKMKEPFLIIDEPEISLHHSYIDDMTETYFNCCSSIKVLLATHSARLLKNVLKNDSVKACIYHTHVEKNYSKSSRIKVFDKANIKERVAINDNVANNFFATLIIAVEGKTEIELFYNSYLKVLFPFLKHSDISELMSDNILMNSVSPLKRGYKTPILHIVDLDKIISIDTKNNQVKFISNFTLVDEKKEQYFFGQKRINTFYTRKRLCKIIEKCKFHYNYPFFSSYDKNFTNFIDLLKTYYLEYDIFVNSTTIEGLLITPQNLNFFWQYIIENHKDETYFKTINEYYTSFPKNTRLNLCRILYNGKSDYLITKKQLTTNTIDATLLKAIKDFKSKKTDGWVTAWLSYYFKKTYIGDIFDIKSFSAFNVNTKNINLTLSNFKKYFPEFFDLLETAKKLY